VPLVDHYPEFLEGRCRPNTVLAAAYDLKEFSGYLQARGDIGGRTAVVERRCPGRWPG